MFAIGNEELAAASPLKAGDKVLCAECGRKHIARDSKPAGVLLFYKCRGKAYLCGVAGKSVMSRLRRSNG